MMPSNYGRKLFVLVGLGSFAGGCDAIRERFAMERFEREKQDAAAQKPDKLQDGPNPTIDTGTHVSAGRLLESQGNLIGAAEQFEKAVAAAPNRVDGWVHLGVVRNRLKQFDQAEKAFKKAVALQPNAAYLHNNLAFTHMLQGQYGPAEKALTAALAVKPDYRRAHMNLGIVYAETGRYDEAVKAFSRVVDKDVAWYNVGLLHAADNRIAAAREAFKQSLAINPKSREAAAQLGRLARTNPSPPIAEVGIKSVSPVPDPAAPVASPAPDRVSLESPGGRTMGGSRSNY